MQTINLHCLSWIKKETTLNNLIVNSKFKVFFFLLYCQYFLGPRSRNFSDSRWAWAWLGFRSKIWGRVGLGSELKLKSEAVSSLARNKKLKSRTGSGSAHTKKVARYWMLQAVRPSRKCWLEWHPTSTIPLVIHCVYDLCIIKNNELLFSFNNMFREMPDNSRRSRDDDYNF